MIFVTDDHRTISLVQKTQQSRGVVPELDDSLMKSLMADTAENLKPRVRVTVDRQGAGQSKKF